MFMMGKISEEKHSYCTKTTAAEKIILISLRYRDYSTASSKHRSDAQPSETESACPEWAIRFAGMLVEKSVWMTFFNFAVSIESATRLHSRTRARRVRQNRRAL
jgi:hypothetical protein